MQTPVDGESVFRKNDVVVPHGKKRTQSRAAMKPDGTALVRRTLGSLGEGIGHAITTVHAVRRGNSLYHNDPAVHAQWR